MSTLVQVAGGIVLDDSAAAAFLTAQRDCRRAGLDLFVYRPVGGLRTVEQIKQMQAAYDLPRGSSARARALAEWGMDPNSRARPITSSPHVSGLAMDVGGSGFAWLVANGDRYGLRRTLVAQGDFPHFQYFPGTEKVRLDVTSLDGFAGGDASTLDPEKKVTDMNNIDALVMYTGNGRVVAYAPGWKHTFASADEYNVWRGVIVAQNDKYAGLPGWTARVVPPELSSANIVGVDGTAIRVLDAMYLGRA